MPDDKPPTGPAPGDPKIGRELVLERKPKTKKPKLYRVVFHNDDYTTMEFVIWVLQVVFHKDEVAARHLMLAIHHKGKGIAGVYTRDIAETKMNQALVLAEQNSMPLMVTTEPDD